ncbi:MAG: AraC family transcriptional regulator ligand-binding domain-containing protein [Cyanobacteria bacterium HKST-UBA02]|nr:AraC family transcriptional regulator ligand-binding domain-containing protein [Cyanobacteria bacterium HKST-UBA02]
MVIDKGIARKFPLDPGMRMLIAELKLEERAILRRAGLPEDLLVQKEPKLSAQEFIRLWEATEAEVGDPIEFPITVGTAASREAFSPKMFSFLCSPNLSVGVSRLSQYKALCGPFSLMVEETSRSLAVTPGVVGGEVKLPESLATTELVFVLGMARRATKVDIAPRRVKLAKHRAASKVYGEYFGVELVSGETVSMVFDREAASVPFLSENQAMWETFEPQLQKRLSELRGDESVSDRVSAALLELLPSGSATMESVASKLAMSKRTLQRRLNEDGVSFQSVLNDTRKELALHYLREKNLPGVEVSFLLGYQEASSFYRAFSSWTGTTPEAVRGK